jgi:hypothetical protein
LESEFHVGSCVFPGCDFVGSVFEVEHAIVGLRPNWCDSWSPSVGGDAPFALFDCLAGSAIPAKLTWLIDFRWKMDYMIEVMSASVYPIGPPRELPAMLFRHIDITDAVGGLPGVPIR